jgi:ADP-ribose pyrophosphatase
MFKKLKQAEVYSDPWLKFYQDEIEFPDGSKGTYAWAQRKNGVGIAVVTKGQKILLHKEYRYIIKDYSWEIPGGGIDEGESPEVAAARELKEETGISVEPSQLTFIARFFPLNSFNTEEVTLFLVEVNTDEVTTRGIEASEHLEEQKFVSFDEALAMVDDGTINDAMTANAIQMVIRRFKKE